MKKKPRQKMANPIPGMGSAGFTGIGDVGPIDFNEAALDRELLELLGESEPKPQQVKKPEKKLVAWDELDSMVSACMVEEDEEDEDIDDPDLEAELLGMVIDDSPKKAPVELQLAPTPIQIAAVSNMDDSSVSGILQQRIAQYKLAVETTTGAKKKRFERQLKSIEKMASTAKNGGNVNIDDIPSPPAGVGINPPPPKTVEQVREEISDKVEEKSPELPKIEAKVPPPIPRRNNIPSQTNQPEHVSNISNNEIVEMKAAQLKFKTDLMKKRLDEYKNIALTSKKSGDKETAIYSFGVMKSIQAALAENNIDDFDMPPVPKKVEQKVVVPKPSPVEQKSPQVQVQPVQTAVQESAPTPPKTILEGLEQRRQIFVQTEQKATTEGNGAKARRIGRQRKQYDDVIKKLKAGQSPVYSHLTVPPNALPLPGESAQTKSFEETLASATHVANAPDDGPELTHEPSARPSPTKQRAQPPAEVSPKTPLQADMPQLPGASKAGSGEDSNYTKQLNFINGRYQEFKTAALEAKKKGDKTKALEYLKIMKGLEPMLNNAQKGLPVDIRKIPPPPDYESFVVVEMKGNDRPKLDRQDSSSARLLDDFANQLKKARSLTTQFTQLGSLEKATLMEKWAKQTQRDMDSVNMALKRGGVPPPVKWEQRHIEAIKINTDLGPEELELAILRVLNVPGDEADMHLFINADFPYPKETPPEIKTRIIKHSKNPVFNQKFKVPISRRHTTFKRAVKNKGIKFVLCQKGGFLRSDKVIGSATVPLIELESKCGHHAVVEIIDGRKPTGAKVEIKFRIREPFEGAEMVSEDLQWVSLESTTTSVAKKAEMKIDIRALSVIKTEIGHCDTRSSIAKRKNDAPASEAEQRKKKQLIEEYKLTRSYLSKNDQNRRNYILSLKVQLGKYNQEAQMYVKSGQKEKAKLSLLQKRQIEEELKAFTNNKTEYV